MFGSHAVKCAAHIGQGPFARIGNAGHVANANGVAAMHMAMGQRTGEGRGARRAIRVSAFRHTRTEGGSAESEVNALTVAPALPSGPSVVTTVTVEATWRMASMKAALGAGIFLSGSNTLLASDTEITPERKAAMARPSPAVKAACFSPFGPEKPAFDR